MKIETVKPDKAGKFYLLPFNRPIKRRAVTALKNSILKNGVIRPVTIVRTDVLDGVQTSYVADGQHLLTALLELNEEIPYITLKCTDKQALFRLVAELNTTALSWSTRDYVRLWAATGDKHYITLQNLKVETDMTFAQLAVALTGSRRGMDPIKHGDFKVKNKTFALKVIADIERLSEVMNINSDIVYAYYQFRKKYDAIDVENLAHVLTHSGAAMESINFGRSNADHWQLLFKELLELD